MPEEERTSFPYSSRLGSTATREYNQAPTYSIFIGGSTAAVVPWQMGVYCRGLRWTVTVLRIFLQSPVWETLIVGDSEQMEVMSMKRLLLVALGMALLLALASALPAAAYDGQASAAMSCTDNTSTMTRTVIVTITWKGVDKYFGVTSAYAAAVEPDNATPLASGRTLVSPPEAKGTASVTLSFSDTAPFGFVQWEIFANTIAPVHAGEINAANFLGCPYP
jgi:hypothetical protein